MKVVEAHKVKKDLMSYAFFERSHMAVVTEGLRNADVVSITGSKYACEFEVKVSKSDLDKELAAIRYAMMTTKEDKQLGPVDSGPEQAALNLEFAGLKNKAGGWSKISKHEEYIDPLAYFEKHKRYMFSRSYIPNYFYLVVPRKWATYAIEQTKGTGYGVIAYNGCRQEGQHMGYFLDGIWYTREDHPEGADWKRGAPCDATNGGRTCYEEIAVKKKATLLHKDPVSEGSLMAILSRAVTENIRMMGEIIALDTALANARKELKEVKI